MRRVEDVMGMPVTVEVQDPDQDPDPGAAVERAFADFALLDRTFSPFLPESAVSRINRGEVEVEAAGPLVEQAVHLCRLYEQATGGYFSAWIDGRFDPSGLVKGWAIDRAANILHGHGLRNFFVDAAGDVQTRGQRAPGEAWRVGVRHPVERDKVACVILASDLAVATSGTYEKGDHIVDPHTGLPARELLSFTVVGPDILQADVFATAAFAMGPAGLDFVAGFDGYEAYAVDHRLVATWTPGFDAYRESPPR